jgi:hypothetical protein
MAIGPDQVDFYLGSTESYDFTEPRRCRMIKRVGYGDRDDCLLIEIDPPAIGQRYGLGGEDIHFLIVATRLEGDSLFPISEWPVSVYLVRSLVPDPDSRHHFGLDEAEMIDWGELYQTEEELRDWSVSEHKGQLPL